MAMLTFERARLEEASYDHLHTALGVINELFHFGRIGKYGNACELRFLGQEFLSYKTADGTACANHEDGLRRHDGLRG